MVRPGMLCKATKVAAASCQALLPEFSRPGDGSSISFSAVLLVWLLWAYNLGFGEQWFPFVGKPGPVASAAFELAPAIVPAAASGMPDLTFPMATLVFFQFVFAAITVIILAGSVLGRMNFKAWVI